MAAADAALGPLIDDGEAPPATMLQQRCIALGHNMEQVGRALFCSSFSAHTILPGGILRDLGAKCNGRSEPPGDEDKACAEWASSQDG